MMANWTDRRGRLSTAASVEGVGLLLNRLAQIVELFGRHEDGAGFRALRRAHDAATLEQVHQPPGPGESDLELALQHRRRPQLRPHDQLERDVEHLVVVARIAAERARKPRKVLLALDTL